VSKKKWIIIGGAALAVLAIGGIASAAGKGGSTAATTTEKTVTVTAPAPAPKTVTVTAPPVTVTAPPPAPVTVTVTAQPNAPTADPAGPKKDGKFMVGSQIEPGTWQCDKPGSFPFWTVHDQANGIVDNGLDSIAIITDEGYTVELDGCSSTWTKVG